MCSFCFAARVVSLHSNPVARESLESRGNEPKRPSTFGEESRASVVLVLSWTPSMGFGLRAWRWHGRCTAVVNPGPPESSPWEGGGVGVARGPKSNGEVEVLVQVLRASCTQGLNSPGGPCFRELGCVALYKGGAWLRCSWEIAFCSVRMLRLR